MSGFGAVVTTGIYCRPGCPAHPKPENVRAFAFAAAAEAAGFRACHRCRPYRHEIDPRATGSALVARAVDLIAAGVMDEHGESAVAARLGVSGRHLRRVVAEQVGATPDQLARSRRAHFARRLLDETDLPISDVAFAAGFGSLRQFNRVMTGTFRAAPGLLRARRQRADRLVADGGLALRLALPEPVDLDAWLRQRMRRAVAGVEHVDRNAYRRVVTVGPDPGVIELRPGPGADPVLVAHLPRLEGLIDLVERVRRLVTGRAPWDPDEEALRCAVEREVGEEQAREVLHGLVVRHGRPVPGLGLLGLTHAFPTPAALDHGSPG